MPAKETKHIDFTGFLERGNSLRKTLSIFFICLFFSPLCHADIASVSYVQSTTNTKVDTSENTQQTLAGEYTVTGTLKVPTQPLPTAE